MKLLLLGLLYLSIFTLLLIVMVDAIIHFTTAGAFVILVVAYALSRLFYPRRIR